MKLFLPGCLRPLSIRPAAVFAFLALVSPSILAQLPAPWTGQDLGAVGIAGSSAESSGTFTIQSSGTDIWGSSDEFHYVHQALSGDASIIARVKSLTDTNAWAKVGVMIRETLATDSKHAMADMTPGNGAQFQRRINTGGGTTNSGTAASAPHWVRLDRSGDIFTAYHSADGVFWSELGSESIIMASDVHVGLAVTSHNNAALCTAVLDNVSIGDPPPPPPPPVLSTDGYLPLFNGVDLTNWYTFLEDGIGVDNDPNGIFKIEDGLMHLLDLADTSSDQPFGYFATADDYRNYRLRFQYKWGTKRYPPRATALRDSGLLYHQIGADVVWPTSVECQVQEGDTGDFFLLGGTRLDTTVDAPGGNTYQEGGLPLLDYGSRVIHSAAYDFLTDWNTVEAIVTEDEGIHLVNGNVNNRGTRFTQSGNPLTEGKIALQVEGAEIFYRDIELKPLFTTGGGPAYKVLVFSKTAGFRHGSIASGIAAVQELGLRNGFQVEATEDATIFNALDLPEFACVVFLNTTGDVLDPLEQAAFENYIRNGGGYVGVHSATDTEYGWPWYGKLVGSYFDGHPAVQNGTLQLEDTTHPSTESIGTVWNRRDEWYNFDPHPRDDPSIRILTVIDEASYSGGGMGADHPISWCHEYDGGRAWYTAMGHTNETYAEPQYRMHLLGGIEWAAGVSREATSDKTVLFGGNSLVGWEKRSGGGPIGWTIAGDSLQVVPGEGDIVTTETFEDFQLHLEFRPNSSNATVEQDRGNSGVYLQGRYEIQILDTYNHPLDGMNDCGAIYNVRNAGSNQSWPADAWQSYDIWFRAARWNGNAKIENARVTVFWNGKLVHDSVEIPNATTAGLPEDPSDGPIMLQDHGNPVRFRNIWIVPGVPLPEARRIAITDLSFDQAAGEVMIAWESNLAGPFRIQAGAPADLAALPPSPDNILPIEVANGAASPATFTLPAELDGLPEVFFQVTE